MSNQLTVYNHETAYPNVKKKQMMYHDVSIIIHIYPTLKGREYTAQWMTISELFATPELVPWSWWQNNWDTSIHQQTQ